jgi:hypothetical protein
MKPQSISKRPAKLTVLTETVLLETDSELQKINSYNTELKNVNKYSLERY